MYAALIPGAGRAAVVLAAALLAACASGPSVLNYEFESQAEHYVWPSPPDPPRYRLVGQLTGEQNLPRANQANIGSRMLTWVAGLVSGKKIPVVLQRPQSGFVDEAGRIYVTDVSRAAVYVFDEAAGKLHVWQSASRTTRFQTPVSITPGANGEVLVVDAGLRRVVRLNADGEPVGTLGEGRFSRPVGVARDAQRGRIYIADAQAHDVKIFSDDGELLGAIGHRGEGPGEFNAPTYLTFARDQLYVTDTLNSRVQIFDAGGNFVREFGRRGLYVGDLPRPKGVAVGNNGIVYVVESYYDHLLVFTERGELLLPIGGTGSGIGQFYLPAGVWTDRRDRIYVADAFNGRIMIFQFLGEA
jgi:DNA-binding beta-propeller fold protein YncE